MGSSWYTQYPINNCSLPRNLLCPFNWNCYLGHDWNHFWYVLFSLLFLSCIYFLLGSGVHTSGYTHLQFAIKAVASGGNLIVWTNAGTINLASYGGQPSVGAWKVYIGANLLFDSLLILGTDIQHSFVCNWTQQHLVH